MTQNHSHRQSGFLGAIVRRLRGDTTGNVLPMAAGAVLVLAALVGGGLDASRSYRVKNRLQNACDSGVLAGRRAVTTNGYDSTAQTQATTFFNTNYDSTQQGTTSTTFSSSSTDNGITVNGSASTTLKTLVMQIFGKTNLTFAVTCSATMQTGNADVTFVLDTTGSMADQPSGFTTSKISALQTAVKAFYTTIYNATNNTNARVRYSFVPYSTTVNVGSLLTNLNPAYVTSSYTVQSRVPRFEVVNYQTFSGSGTQYKVNEQAYYSSPNSSATQYNGTAYGSWGACTAALPSDTTFANNGSSSSSSTYVTIAGSSVLQTTVSQPQSQRLYLCQRSGDAYYVYYYDAWRYYKTYTYATSKSVTGTSASTNFDHFDYRPVTYDMSSYKGFNAINIPTGSSGTSVSSTWNGCIEERYTNASGSVAWSSSTSSMSPATAMDLDIDTAPTNDPATQWAPIMPEAAYFRNTTSPIATSGSLAGSWCPAAASTLQAMTQSDFNNYVNSLTPNGDTYHDIGMLWGARLSSPTGLFASLVNAIPSNGGKVSRHIIYMTDGIPNADYSVQQAYGIEYNDRRITADGYTDDDNRHEMRFRAICDAVKAKGIRIWVIGYTTALTSDLSYCASPNSSFTAMYAADLNTAFQQIARQVSQLQVTQ